MKIKIKKTKEVEVELSKKQVSKIAIKAVKKAAGLPDENLYIMYRNDQKYICYDEEVYTSHTFDIRHEVRVATQEDEFILDLIKRLQEYK